MQVAVVIAQDSGNSSGQLVSTLLFFGLVGFVMYLVLIRPQRKRMREQAALQAGVGVGDEVITTSGVYGFITGEDGPDRFWLEIDDDVQIRIARAAIQRKVDTSATDGADDKAGDKAATSTQDDDADEQ